MKKKNEVFLIVDQDQRYRKAQSHGRALDIQQEAWLLSRYANVLGSQVRKLAIVSAYDPAGLAAYQRYGFETLAVNGNRPAELQSLIQTECNWLDQHKPGALVLVTSDPRFAKMSSHAAQTLETEVYIWSDKDQLPQELAEAPYQFRDLNDLFPTQNRVAVFLDYENLYIGLEKAGYCPDATKISQALDAILNGIGEVAHISAYADWDNLRRGTTANLQRELVQQGIETKYLIAENGKNSADMRIANDVRDWIENRGDDKTQADILVLGTGDRDFRDSVKAASDRKLKVIILSLRSSLSAALGEMASEVHFLEDYLQKPATETVPQEALKSNLGYMPLVMKIQVWMKRQNYRWAFVNELIEALNLDPIQIAHLHRAVEASIFTQSKRWSKDANQEIITIQINYTHPLNQAIEYFLTWVVRRISNCMEEKGWQSVHTNYLVQGMAWDRKLKQFDIGQNPADANQLLEAACLAGVLVKQTIRLSNPPNPQITTWRLSKETLGYA